MYREIKFKGLSVFGKKWIYGNIKVVHHPYIAYYIDGILIINGSVCQFTGAKDKIDNDIYENDIVKSANGRELYVVIFKEYAWRLIALENTGRRIQSFSNNIQRQTLIDNMQNYMP